MKVTWIGHACLLLQTSRLNMVTDPWLIDPIFGGVISHHPPRTLGLEDLPEIDVIALTHAHFDHFDPETLKHLNKNAIVIIPAGPLRKIDNKLQSLGFKKIIRLRPWQTFTHQGFSISATPSVGVPEELGYVLQGEGATVFHAADSLFEPIAEKIVQKFKIDIAFIPYCGWDQAALFGIEPDKTWEPDYRKLSRSCQLLKTSIVVPAASNTCWQTEDLKWLNNRVCPGKIENFFKILSETDPSIQPLRMEPGECWSKEEGHLPLQRNQKNRDIPSNLQKLPFHYLSFEEVSETLVNFLKKRRRQLFISFFYSPKASLSLLTTRFSIASHDGCEERIWAVNLLSRNILGAKKSHYSVSIAWPDLCQWVRGHCDIQDLILSRKVNLTDCKNQEAFLRLLGIEYLFHPFCFSPE